MSAQPLLSDAAGLDWLAGTGKVNLAVAGQGANELQIMETLNGKADLAIVDGAIVGINIPGMARALGAVLVLVALVGVATARAEDVIPRGPILVPGGVPNPGYCWAELKLFDTLRYGPFDFCRKRLAYRPGRLECAQIGEIDVPESLTLALLVRDVVKSRRMFEIVGRRLSSGEGHAYRELGVATGRFDRDAAANQAPDPILWLAIIERAELPRHRDRHQHEPPPLDRPLERKTGPKGRDVVEPRDLVPAGVGVDLDLDPHWQRQGDPLDAAVLFLRWRGDVRLRRTGRLSGDGRLHFQCLRTVRKRENGSSDGCVQALGPVE